MYKCAVFVLEGVACGGAGYDLSWKEMKEVTPHRISSSRTDLSQCGTSHPIFTSNPLLWGAGVVWWFVWRTSNWGGGVFGKSVLMPLLLFYILQEAAAAAAWSSRSLSLLSIVVSMEVMCVFWFGYVLVMTQKSPAGIHLHKINNIYPTPFAHFGKHIHPPKIREYPRIRLKACPRLLVNVRCCGNERRCETKDDAITSNTFG